jgi:hypothetical protein
MKNGAFWNITSSSYLTGNILYLRYRAQPVTAMKDLRCSRWLLRRMQSSEIKSLSSYLTGNTLRLRYRAQPVNAT